MYMPKDHEIARITTMSHPAHEQNSVNQVFVLKKIS